MNALRQSGQIEAIHIAPAATGGMVALNHVEAVAGKGLVGDRYADAAGTFSQLVKDYELTLIEAEAIEAMNLLPGVSFKPGEIRRNLTTRGVSLNQWVGRDFTIGAVRCRGTRLCPPCAHLQKLLGIEDLIQIMHDRGGLRAVIIDGGMIRVGDLIET
jgi:MOSC domain-containing protein YiiM